MALSDSGSVIAAWGDDRGGPGGVSSGIYAQRIGAAGVLAWVVNGVAVGTGSNDLNPSVVSDSSGGALVAWEDSRGTTQGDIYAQRLDASGGSRWVTNGAPVCILTGIQTKPEVASDGAGGAIIVWEDRADINNYVIRAQRLDAAGSKLWAPLNSGVAICSAARQRFRPKVITDGVGGAIITWEDMRLGPPFIYAQRITSSGVAQWVVDGIRVCTFPSPQSFHVITAAGAGRAIIAWQDSRGDGSIYAQSLDASGARLWGTLGTAVCTATGFQVAPQVASDGVGGVVIAWQDPRSGTAAAFAQRLNSGGQPQWTSDGVRLGVASGSQTNPVIASNGTGGALVTWEDARSGNVDIYAQHVLAGGALDPAFSAGGRAVCTAPGNQSKPSIVASSPGVGVVAWADPRGSDYDIYCQRVSAIPVNTGVGDTGRPGFEFLSLGNPSKGGAVIAFSLDHPQEVSVQIFDARGHSIRLLQRRAPTSAGIHSMWWDGRNEKGVHVASGIYFARIEADSQARSRKFVLLR
jgi:hypothetical protein